MKPTRTFKELLVQSLRSRLIAIAGAAAVAGLTAALLINQPRHISAAADPSGTPTGGERRQDNPELREQQHDQLRTRVAANLGITPERLTEAFNQARKDVLQDLVQQGKITQEQADRRIARITKGLKPGASARISGHGNPGDPGQTGARVPGPQGRAIGGVIAQALGLTPKDLRDALNSGKTLTQIAQDKGLSIDQLRTSVSDHLEQRLNAAVQSGSLTTEQAAQIRTRHQQMIEHLISGLGRRGGPGRGQPVQP
jgi:uncharacterized protein YidB (DUF937 family)